MTEALVCWHCGASIAGLPLPLSRRAECPACSADLHVCLMCAFYDETAAQSCSEPVADEVKAKDRANFCGYFEPRAGAYAPANDDAAARARAELEALFGLAPPPQAGAEESEEVRRAREELERLFPSPGDDSKGS
ncbi:MAG: hypothetical protein U5S82_15930 [Gammaproteobacteria bacterium]|nr:hypothetical protein [Gammaproteobacteria bacterium]